MRLYRFIETDKKIDVTVVTDGSCDQERIFITEIRGIVSRGNVDATADEIEGSDNMQALGFNWVVGQPVMHQELVAFAEDNALILELNPQGQNEIVSANVEWNKDNECVITVRTQLPIKKEVEIYFPNIVTLNESAGRWGVIRGDRKGLVTDILSRVPVVLTMEDMGLTDKEDLNVVIMAEGGIQKFEFTAKAD